MEFEFVLMKISFLYLTAWSSQHSLVVAMPSFYIPMKVEMLYCLHCKIFTALRPHPQRVDRCDCIIQLADVKADKMSYLLAPRHRTRSLSLCLSMCMQKRDIQLLSSRLT